MQNIDRMIIGVRRQKHSGTNLTQRHLCSANQDQLSQNLICISGVERVNNLKSVEVLHREESGMSFMSL
jgi:hypothetical protein